MVIRRLAGHRAAPDVVSPDVGVLMVVLNGIVPDAVVPDAVVLDAVVLDIGRSLLVATQGRFTAVGRGAGGRPPWEGLAPDAILQETCHRGEESVPDKDCGPLPLESAAVQQASEARCQRRAGAGLVPRRLPGPVVLMMQPPALSAGLDGAIGTL